MMTIKTVIKERKETRFSRTEDRLKIVDKLYSLYVIY